jgi:hypothetical protein
MRVFSADLGLSIALTTGAFFSLEGLCDRRVIILIRARVEFIGTVINGARYGWF